MEGANSPDQWFRALPCLTKWMALLTFCASLLSVLGVDPSLWMFDSSLIVGKLHVWRLLSNHFFLGKFSISWLFEVYIFCQFSSKLESSAIFGRNAGAYLYFILIQMLCLDLFSILLHYPAGIGFLGDALTFAILYYWSRREPYVHIGLWGFTVEAYKFPFTLMLLHLMMGRTVMLDILGLLAGHLYYFFRELLPAENGPDLLATPPHFLDLFVIKLRDLFGETPFNSRTNQSQYFTGTGYRLRTD